MKLGLPKISKKSLLTFSAGGFAAGILTGFSDFNPEPLVAFLSESAQSQIAQAGFFFTIAAWLHSGRVKKEIKSNFDSLTNAINKVADAFREDLKRHGDRLDNLDSRVQILEVNPTKE